MCASANEAMVRRAVQTIWNRGDLEVADELFACDYVNHCGLIVDLVRGPEAIKISAALYRLAFPDLRVDIEQLSSNADIIVLRWAARSGAPGATGGHILGTGERSLRGITRGRFAEGKIVESWTEWDQTGALRQLGVVPRE